MSTLAKGVHHLRKERDQAQSRLDQLDKALKALTRASGAGGIHERRSGAQASGKRKTMSPAARKRIAAAQRVRWAKWKAAQRTKE